MKKQIFPSIESIHLGFDKIEVTRALWSVCPNYVPKTLILGKNKDTMKKILATFSFPFVAKEIRNSMGRGVFFIKNREQFLQYANNNDILYIQEYLPIDRDLRIVVVGTEVIHAYWRIGKSGSFLNNISQGGIISFDNIPQQAIKLVTSVARHLNINHAGFDLAFANNQYYFLEFNTLFGNKGFKEAGISVEKIIYSYLETQIAHIKESQQRILPQAHMVADHSGQTPA